MTHPMDSATGQLLNNRIFLESSGEIRKGYPELSMGLFQCDGFSYWMLSIRTDDWLIQVPAGKARGTSASRVKVAVF